jgi:integrase
MWNRAKRIEAAEPRKPARKGTVKRAKVLDEAAIDAALKWVDQNSQQPERDRLLILLTCHLGLRPQEAALVWADDIFDARGNVRRDAFFVSARGAKYGKERYVPMTDEVLDALCRYVAKYKSITTGPLFFNQYAEPLRATAVHKRLKVIYDAIGLKGCSSHSGRRTFGTRAAREIAKVGGSLEDVRHLMGHAYITTTAAYVETTPRQNDLVRSLFSRAR